MCDVRVVSLFFSPIGSMYGIFTYIYHKNQLNVGKYTVHGSYRLVKSTKILGRNFFPTKKLYHFLDSTWLMERCEIPQKSGCF